PLPENDGPNRLGSPIATRGDGQVLYARTGLYPIVAANEHSPNVIHRAAARVLGSALKRAPTLRNNRGALTTLLASGLAIFFALSVSWSSTLFLASLGALVWLVVRQLNRSAELASVVATREAAVQLCLLQEDFGLIRTVRVHGMENYDKQRFDDHLERYRDAEI